MSEDLYMLLTRGVYRSTKDYMQVTGLYIVGGQILCGWEKLYCSRSDLIVIGFQPIVLGRAKIIRGVEGLYGFVANTSMYKQKVVCSREVACSFTDILYG